MARHLTLRALFLMAMLMVVLLVTVTYSTLVYHVRTTDVIQEANVKLLMAGHFAQSTTGPGYHKRIVDQTSVPKEEFERITAAYDEMCLKEGLQYIWSLMELDGKIVFTSGTHSVLTNKNSDCATFLEVHTNPDAYRHAFDTMQLEFSTFHDKWGEGRMVLLPGVDSKQRKHLFAASIQLASFDALLHRTLVESILIGLFIAAPFSLVAMLLSRLLTRPLTRLTVAIERMGKGELDVHLDGSGVAELKTVVGSFEQMRQTVKQKMEALRDSEERFRSLVENLSIGVALISPKMEILALNHQMRTWYPQIDVGVRPVCYQVFNEPPRGEACSYCPVTQTLQDGEVHEAITETPRADGVTSYRIVASPLKDEAGQVHGVIEMVEDITDRKRIEDTLKRSQADLNAILESTPDIIFLLDAQDGRLQHFNAAFAREAERTYGVRPRVGMTAKDILPADRVPVWAVLFQRVLMTQQPYSKEYLRPSDQKYFEVNFNTVWTENRLTSVSIFIRDITVRKQAEMLLQANEAKLRVLFNILPVGISIVDGEHRLVSMNPELSHILGLPEEDLKRGVHTQRRYLRSDGTPMPPEEFPSMRARKEGGEVRNVEIGVLKEDGAIVWTLVSANLLPSGGVAIATRDITERKQAEADLLASENRWRSFLDNSAVIGWMKDEEGRHVFVSDNFLRRFHTRREDRIGKTDFELWPRPVAEQLRRNDQAVLENGLTLEVVEQVANPDGSPSWWLVSKFVFQDAAGKRFVGGLGVDITARKQAEAQLRESEERYRWLADNTEDFVSVHDVEEKRLYISPSYYRATGWTPADLEGSPWDARLHPDDLPAVTFARAANRAGQSTLIEHRIRCRNGDWLWVEARCKPVAGPDGQVKRLIVWSHDITARKRFEEALHDSQAHLTAVLESTHDLIWALDANTLEVLSFNSALAQEVLDVYGVQMRTGMSLREIVPADRLPDWEQLLQRSIKQGRYTDEYFRPDHPKYFERTFNPIVEEGQAAKVAIFARDITARKRAEAALLESEEKFLRLAGHIESVLYSVDTTTREFRYLSPAFEKLFGYTAEDIHLMGGRRAFLGHVIQGEQFREQDHYLEAVQHENQAASYHTDSWWRCKDGTLRYIHDHWMPVYEQGQLVSTEGVLADITKEKAAEDKLRESESQLKAAQRLAKLGSWTWDLMTGQVTWSDELYAIWGLDRDRPSSALIQYMKLFLPKSLLDAQSGLRQATLTGEGYVFETDFLCDDGTGGHLLVHGTSERGQDGRIIRLYGTAQDVSERKRLEQQILEISEREQRRIGQDLHDGVGQQLTALRFLSSALRQKLLERKKVEPREFERLDNMLAETLQDVRGLSRGLHPVNADSHGLMHGLRELCRALKPMFGVPCEFVCEAPVLVHRPVVALNLYRIAQEATRNAATHGAPKHIRVQLSQKAGLLKLVIQDDGKGLPRDKPRRGLGLEIMQYRAHTIGATLDVNSASGAGVTITCELACRE